MTSYPPVNDRWRLLSTSGEPEFFVESQDFAFDPEVSRGHQDAFIYGLPGLCPPT
jgi:hypothetical protein